MIWTFGQKERISHKRNRLKPYPVKQFCNSSNFDIVGIHLHLLVFPFVYQFNSRIRILVYSSFASDKLRRISKTFQHNFKMCSLWFLHKKECSFYTYLFCCTEKKWMFISSTAIWFTSSDTGSVAFRARGQLDRSKCEWTRIWTN